MKRISAYTCRQTMGAIPALLLAILCLLIWTVKGSRLVSLLSRRLLLDIMGNAIGADACCTACNRHIDTHLGNRSNCGALSILLCCDRL
jgi:hypothetical protein